METLYHQLAPYKSAVNFADILMSAATFQNQTQSCRYKSAEDKFSKHDGIAWRGNSKSYLELKYRHYNMSFFLKYPPHIELDKYIYLRTLNASHYVYFVEDNDKMYMLSWDISDESILLSAAPKTAYLPATTSFGKKEKKAKQILELDIEKATILDVTNKMQNNIPIILKRMQNKS